MDNPFIKDTVYTDKKFDNLQLSSEIIERIELENCEFRDCTLSNINFSSCVFSNCIFSNTAFIDCKFTNSRLDDCTFRICKMLGIDWSLLRTEFSLELQFEKSDLSYGYFSNTNFSGSSFTDCRFTEADFSGAVLRNASFTNCDLQSAIFMRTDLRDVDLTTSRNYLFDPSNNSCKGLKLSYSDASALLQYFGIIVE